MSTETEMHLIDRIYEVIKLSEDDADTHWAVGISLLGGVLLRCDQFTRERLLKSLPLELRAAVDGIQSLMRGAERGPYPESPPRLH
jgi:hypothetical protein